jgi:hypothetical protein
VTKSDAGSGAFYESVELDSRLGSVAPGGTHPNSWRYTGYNNGTAWGSRLQDYWWNEETISQQVVDQPGYNTYEYSTEQVYQYKYYRWKAWSDWSTTVYTKSSTRNVENKTQYRYRGKPLA